MNPLAQLMNRGAIRSGEFTNPYTRKRLPIPDGFRYYEARYPSRMPETARAEAEAILKRNPRTKFIIARRA